MSSIPTHATPAAPTVGRSTWTVPAIAGAALANVVLGAVAKAADVPLVANDMKIQLPMFAVFTLIGAALGVGLSVLLAKRAAQPQRAFIITTVVLAAFSIVPDLAADATTATKVTLISAHALAAVVIIPALAARLGKRTQLA